MRLTSQLSPRAPRAAPSERYGMTDARAQKPTRRSGDPVEHADGRGQGERYAIIGRM